MPETRQERMLRHIRNWIAVFVIVTAAGGLAIGAQIASHSPSADCVSQGGTVQGC